jgi:hypothetical protein
MVMCDEQGPHTGAHLLACSLLVCMTVWQHGSMAA